MNEFWDLLLGAQPQTRPVPPTRWNHTTFFSPDDRRSPHRSCTDQVSFLDEVEEFDPLHYGIPPKRARAMDPQHRLLVDLAREAIQDAGWERHRGMYSRTAVIVGMSASDYRELSGLRISSAMLADGSFGPTARDDGLLTALDRAAGNVLEPVQPASLAGCLINMGPCTVSSVFDLNGPAFAVDAACSSALVALQAAMVQLEAGVCDAALVGGVFLNLTPNALVGFSRIGALSHTGRCRPFDKAADGFVLGEGGALAVIRPLDAAIAAGDRIYAVVRGVGISNDGAGGGPMTPKVAGQLEAMRAAYADAELAPGAVDVIEAHGTGTPVGDRVEIEALNSLRQQDERQRPCYLSSGKALIGHALSAAGAAGLLKAALIAHHRTLPPQPTLVPADEQRLTAAGLSITQTPRVWTDEHEDPLLVAVSSFGFGGTNVHAVLQEHPRESLDPDAVPWPILLSAGSLTQLERHADNILTLVGGDHRWSVASISRTLTSRTMLPARLGLVATTRRELVERLTLAVRGLREGRVGAIAPGIWVEAAPLPASRRRLAFVFPGQGSQRVGMLRDALTRSASAAEYAERLATAAEQVIDSPLLDLLRGESSAAAEDRLTRTELCQPALGVVGVVLADLLRRCGVRPDIVVGHSVGEFAAGVAAEAVDAVDATVFLAQRGRAVAASGGDPGGMLAVQTDADRFTSLVTGLEGVWAGCYNNPSQVVASGDLDALDTLRERCEAAGVAASSLKVSHAFHSPRMRSADSALAATLAAMRVTDPMVPLVSCVSGERCDDAEHLRASWSTHCAAPVRFTTAIECVNSIGADIYLQLYGGQSLLGSVRRTIGVHPTAVDREPMMLAATGQTPDGGETLTAALTRLAVLGVPVDFAPLFRDAPPELVTLPPSPLAAKRHTVRLVRAGSAIEAPNAPGNDAPPVKTPAPEVSAASGSDAAAKPLHRATASPPLRKPTTMIDLVRLFREQIALLHDLHSESPAGTHPAERHDPPESVDGGRTDRQGPADDADHMDWENRAGHGPDRRRPAAHAAASAVDGHIPAHTSDGRDHPARDGRSRTHHPDPRHHAHHDGRTHPDPRSRAHQADRRASTIPTTPNGHSTSVSSTSMSSASMSSASMSASSIEVTTGAAAHDHALDIATELISAVSAYPRSFIQPDHDLRNQLGFDSIMMADLISHARRRWPGFQVDLERLPAIVTVRDLCGLLPMDGAATISTTEAPIPPAEPTVIPTHTASRGHTASRENATPHHAEGAPSIDDEATTRSSAPTSARADIALPVESVDVRAFPEVRTVVERGRRARELGIPNPYFLVHDGTIRDTTSIENREVLSFSSYNYLGLSGHPTVRAAIGAAVDRYGSSVSAARILSGHRPIHTELEGQIAQLLRTEDALTLVSGHGTNVSVIGHLLGADDLVLHDGLAHDSILQGCRLSGAHRQPFPHNDVSAIEDLLRAVRGRYRRVLIIIEGVYSMDGDVPDLPAIIEVKNRFGALLMIDEAHSIGVLGRSGAGVGEHFGVDAADVDIWMGTLSKSFASCGGYVAGRRELIEYFRYTLPGFIYSAGMTPANTAAASAAIGLMRSEPERVERLKSRSALLHTLLRDAGLNVGFAIGKTPIVPCVFGDSEQTLHVADLLLRTGVSVNPILYPAVDERATRLRFFVTAEHTPEQIETAATALIDAARTTARPSFRVSATVG